MVYTEAAAMLRGYARELRAIALAAEKCKPNCLRDTHWLRGELRAEVCQPMKSKQRRMLLLFIAEGVDDMAEEVFWRSRG